MNAPRRPGLLERVRGHPHRLGAAAYAGVLSAVSLAVPGVVGLVSHQPWLFPSLGPTVMLFFESPEQPSARPINTLVGHGVGIAAGVLCLAVFGLNGRPPAPVAGLSAGYVAAAVTSVAITTIVLTLVKLPHPPAGASTLIVSLGILSSASEILTMAGAVVLITVIGWGMNIVLGTRPADPKHTAASPRRDPT